MSKSFLNLTENSTPEEIKKGMRDFLQDTTEFYNLGNRAEVTGGCRYETEDGRKCAVGRYLTGSAILVNPDVGYLGLLQEHPEIIPSWMKLFQEYFVCHVQSLHDKPENWSETGISKAGERRVSNIIERYKL